MYKVVSFLFILIVSYGASAQSGKRTISGLVTSDEGTPLENAGVWVKGTEKSSGTQADGIYYITVSDSDQVLVFKASEFEEQEISIKSATAYDVQLKRKSLPTAFSLYGKWRGLFQFNSGNEVPINFEITGSSPQTAKVFFINGAERFEGGRVSQKGDSIFILSSPFDNELAFKINGGSLDGVLRKQDHSGTPIPLKASHADFRFATTGVIPKTDISGTYAVTFENQNGEDEKGVGLFTQEGEHLKATFLRITGDSRYLEGIVSGNQFFLSSFIGSGPTYYKGNIAANGMLSGEIINSKSKQLFEAKADENAALPDAYKLTLLKEGYKTLDFSLPDLHGKLVSLKDQRFKNKAVVITIGGTWCPNCIDETAFLVPWYKANHKKGVEVIAIQYERQDDSAFIRKAFARFNQKFDVPYTQVIGGTADKQKVAESLPALNNFLSFPTTIFINKKGVVSKIHTGFTGPATGKYYTEFVKEFSATIDQLLNE